MQPRLGGRKLFHLLQPFMARHRMFIGRDTFFKMLGKYGLLNKRSRRSKPRTTDSAHWMKKHPNLIRGLVPIRSNQVWVSDITYLEMCDGDAFLSLITDAYSRKIVGFHVNNSLRAEGCLQALEMAISNCDDTTGLIHHSDRGGQYCCGAYVNLLTDRGIAISMTQCGNPRDNAIAERVNGILKMELLAEIFVDLQAARIAVSKAVNTYNFLRPHSSISMLCPALVHGRELEVERCWKNYYKTGKEAKGWYG